MISEINFLINTPYLRPRNKTNCVISGSFYLGRFL